MRAFLRAVAFSGALFMIFQLSACGTKKLAAQTLTIEKSDGTKLTVQAEMARTAAERNHGYMERKNIPDGNAMLFLFDRDQILSFWMKNTPSPLSIAFIDSQGKIRDIFDMTPFSLADVDSTVSVRYALEVPQGWYSRAGISTGDTLVLDFDTRCEK